MRQESREVLPFLSADGKAEDSPRDLVNMQASHAETVLELQKTRNLLLLEHRISKDLQVHTCLLRCQIHEHITKLRSALIFLIFNFL